MKTATGQKLYPIVDRLTEMDRKTLGIELGKPLSMDFACSIPSQIMGVRTGDKRQPRKGEWYLSGNPAEVYRAPNDLSTDFLIMRLVKVRTETKYFIEPTP